MTTLLKVTGGHTFTGIAPKGYQIQEDQPSILSEEVLANGFTQKKLGTYKITTIDVTFAPATEAETAANLYALVTASGQLQFDYWSPTYQVVRRAYFWVNIDQAKIMQSLGAGLYDSWTVKLVQVGIISLAVPTTYTVSALPTANTTSGWTNPTHAYTDNNGDSYAWTHGTKDTVVAITLGFVLPAIPTDATINAVTMEMNYRVSSTASAASVAFIATHAGVDVGSGWASTAEPSAWTKVSAYAGIWTPAMLNDGTACIKVWVYRTGSSAAPYYCLDYARLSVTYTTES